MIKYIMNGNRQMLLDADTSLDWLMSPKVQREVRADAAILANVQKRSIEIITSDGRTVARVEPELVN